jgi:hypothetical protein
MKRHIYFAQCKDRIKIGISRHVVERLSAIRTAAGEPIDLIATVEGNAAVEKALHKKLRPYHLDGEWFRDCPEVRAAIQNSVNNFTTAVPVPKRRDIRNVVVGPVCKVIWPNKTDAYVAAICGCDPRNARRYLSGELPIPAVLLAAINVELVKRGI